MRQLNGGTDRLVEQYTPLMESIREANGHPNLADTPRSKRRVLALAYEAQMRWMKSVVKSGTLGRHFPARVQEVLLADQRESSLVEVTDSGDIQALATQILMMIDVIYERIVVDQLLGAGMMSMNGPKALVGSIDHLQGDAGNFYAAGTSLNEGLDIDYADCPTAECTPAKHVDFSLALVELTAVCKRLASVICIMAEQDAESQYGISLPARMRNVIAIEIAREIQGEIINLMVANAGYNENWPVAVPAGSVYANLDPAVYANTIYNAITSADLECFKATDGRRGTNTLSMDPDVAENLMDLRRFTINMDINTPRSDAGKGDIDEFGNLFGIANGRWNVWLFPFMTANTILLSLASQREDEVAQIHAVYVPLLQLPEMRDPETGEIKVGAMTRVANHTPRPGLLATVTLT